MTLRPSLQAFVVVSLALAAFAVSLGGGFVSDDAHLLRAAEGDLVSAVLRRYWQVRGEVDEQGLYGGAYRPFSQLALALQARLFGQDPAPFHAVSVLLHAGNAFLSLRWLSRRLRSADGALDPSGQLAALLGAALFAVHPAHAESVAWISGATDLWMTFHLLLGCELLELGVAGRALAPLAFACAVFSKEPAAVAPALCLLDAWARGLPRSGVLTRTALAALGAGAAGLVVLSVGAGAPGAASAPFDVSSALALTGRYLLTTLFPAHLTFQAQPFLVDAQGIHVAPVMITLGAVAWALLVAALVLGLQRPRLRALAADAAWFCLLLLPVIVWLQNVVSDRFLYAPLLGACALAARGLSRAFASALGGLRSSALLASAGAVVLALSASTRAAAAFADEVTLWRSQVAAYPDNPKALDALGEALSARGEHTGAGRCFERGLEKAHAIGQRAVALHFAAHLIALPVISRPEWDEAAWEKTARGCDSLFRRGRAEHVRGEVRFAVDVSRSELRALERSPALLLVPCTRAMLGASSFQAALQLARRAVSVAPDDLAAAEIYALALARAGDFDAALKQVERGLALRPVPQLADLRERIAAAREASREKLAPDDVRGRGMLAFQIALSLGSPRAARAALAPALAVFPVDYTLVQAVAQTYVAERRFDRAYAQVQAAQRQQPADPHWERMLQALASAEAELQAMQRGAEP